MKQFRPLLLQDVVPFAPKGEIRLKDIQRWYVLGGLCQRCKHLSELDRFALERRFGKDATARDLERRMRCKHCQNRGNNTILVINQWPR